MVKHYVKFKTPKRGVPNSEGGNKRCMNCNKPATMTAVKVKDNLRMDVWFCTEHGKYAQWLG